MMWFFALLIVLLIGAVVVATTGVGEPMSEEYDDRPDVRVQADGPLGPDDLRNVRFTTAVRGYRASEVDSLLARLVREMSGEPAPAGAPHESVPLPESTTAPSADHVSGLPVVRVVRQAGSTAGR